MLILINITNYQIARYISLTISVIRFSQNYSLKIFIINEFFTKFMKTFLKNIAEMFVEATHWSYTDVTPDNISPPVHPPAQAQRNINKNSNKFSGKLTWNLILKCTHLKTKLNSFLKLLADILNMIWIYVTDCF